MNALQHCSLKCFAARGGEQGWPWMFFPPPLTFISVFLILPLSTVSWLFWYPYIRSNWSDLWYAIHILSTLNYTLYSCLLKRRKYLDLFLNLIEEMTWSSSCLISGSDHSCDGFSASFHLFSYFSKSSLRWKVFYVISDQYFNSMLLHYSLQHTDYTVCIWDRKCCMVRHLMPTGFQLWITLKNILTQAQACVNIFVCIYCS